MTIPIFDFLPTGICFPCNWQRLYVNCAFLPPMHKSLSASQFVFAMLAYALMSVCCGRAFAGSDRIALVIGISDYKYARSLRNPVNDAMLVRKALSECGFKVLHNRDSDNVSRRKMIEMIREFHDQIKPGGVALFYYAGHGCQVDNANYLVATDSNAKRQFEVESECVPLKRVFESLVRREIGTPKADTNIILLDCCRDNPFNWSGRSFEGGLAPQESRRKCIVSYAAEPNRKAIDGEGDHSPYSAALARYIKVEGLTIEEILKKVANDVASRTSQDQFPIYWSGLDKIFCFVPDGSPEKTLPKLIEQKPIPAPSQAKPNPKSLLANGGDIISLVRQIADANNENDPAAFIPYLQLPMKSFHGKQNAGRDYIIADRSGYISRWPSRDFSLMTDPVVRSFGDGSYEVITRSTYKVQNSKTGKVSSGITSITYRMRQTSDGSIKVESIEESASKLKSTKEQKNTGRRIRSSQQSKHDQSTL